MSKKKSPTKYALNPKIVAELKKWRKVVEKLQKASDKYDDIRDDEDVSEKRKEEAWSHYQHLLEEVYMNATSDLTGVLIGVYEDELRRKKEDKQ